MHSKSISKPIPSHPYLSSGLPSSGSYPSVLSSFAFWKTWLRNTGLELSRIGSIRFQVDPEHLEKEFLSCHSQEKAVPKNLGVGSGGNRPSIGNESDDFAQIINRCRLSLNREPESQELRWILVRALYGNGQFDSASQNLKLIRKADPESPSKIKDFGKLEWNLWILRNWWLPAVAMPTIILISVALRNFQRTHRKFSYENAFRTLKEENQWHS